MRDLMRLAVATFGLSGCALAIATPPSVDVLDVRLTGIGLVEQQLAVTVCVTNPNSSPLAFRHFTADLDVAGFPVAAGSSDQPVRLAPLSSTVVPITVVTTTQNLGPQLLGIIRAGSLDYRIHGSVSLYGPFGITVPYSRSGRLDPVADGLKLASAAADPTPSRCLSGVQANPI